ncbi:hypothetical protein A3197_12820 [Candidatus Thiodiazotropha endoloripes]|nr:hypothetical protein A3197_12820 [Candidatus Thiodiazotropha endoloripes]
MYKAVRVRLLDSKISADLLNINLYLSPYDVWNATLRKSPETGLPNLITEDESCTIPVNSQLQAGFNITNPYSKVTNDDLTEGYIEIIDMGDIADGPGAADDSGNYAEIDASGSADGNLNTTAGDQSITEGIMHQDGSPPDCSVVVDAWKAGASSSSTINGFEPGVMGAEGIAEDNGDSSSPYDNSQNAGLVAPSGGLKAYGILIDVGNGAAYVQEAEHIDRYTTVPQHYLPSDPAFYRLPSLASGDIREAYITDGLGSGRKGDTMPLTEYDTGALQDISPLPSVPMGSNPFPIATVLSTEKVSIPFFVEENLNGKTEIALTFPMYKHGIYNSGIITNQVDPEHTPCAGTLNDGIDDGQAVGLTGLGVAVQDFPHYSNGSYCENAGYIDNVNQYNTTLFDVQTEVAYYNYEGGYGVFWFHDGPCINCTIYYPSPFDLFLERSVNINQVKRFSGSTGTLFGTPSANAYELSSTEGFQSGSITFEFPYEYEYKESVIALTEPAGGLGATVSHSWRGVPVIGFAAISSEVESNTLGETIDLVRHVHRD